MENDRKPQEEENSASYQTAFDQNRESWWLNIEKTGFSRKIQNFTELHLTGKSGTKWLHMENSCDILKKTGGKKKQICLF